MTGAASMRDGVRVGPRADWWQTGVVYQIYPRSFADANGDGVGDLPGIIEHLDHLNGRPDSLGVDAVWLSPIYPSPDFDFGYDVADYVGIDPRFGTLADFERLVAAAHERGIRIVMDLVLNHTSHQHAWFEASRADRHGPYGDWYLWRDPAPGSGPRRRRRPNNWRSFFGGPGWTWDPVREQFYFHTFLAEQPDLNWRNPSVRAAILDVVRTWLDRGVDGFRLDVFNSFFKDAGLRANPRRKGTDAWSRQRHVHDRNQPELAEFLAELRAMVDERPGRMTVGEMFDGLPQEAAGYVAPRHLIFDWAIMFVPWDAGTFARAVEARERLFGAERWPANALSNHDQPRHATRFDVPGSGVGGLGDARAKVAAAALLTLRGTPFLYYGEELAQRDVQVPRDQAFDPFVRRAEPGREPFNRDECRGPMAWTPAEPAFGFTSGTPWLPASADAAMRNVERQSADPESVLSWYRRLLALRRATPALHRGDQQPHEPGDAEVFSYVRGVGVGEDAGEDAGERGDSGRAFVALNFADRDADVALPDTSPGSTWRVALSTHARPAGESLADRLTLGPLEALIAVEA